MREWLARFRDWMRRDVLDAELTEELRFHREQLERDAQLSNEGNANYRAQHIARKKLGNITGIREAARDRWSIPSLDNLLQDVRYAVRGLWRAPAFSIVAILTLALGIGANSAIFSVVNSVVLRPLPYANSNALVMVASERDGKPMSVSVRDFTDWRNQVARFAGLVAGFAGTTVLTGSGTPERLSQARVSANAFDVLKLRPVLGRAFHSGEDDVSAPRIAMLSEGVWHRRFGGDSTVIGRTLVFDGFPTTIVGIAPAAMQWPARADVFMTTRFSDHDLAQSSRGARWLDVVGRVKDGSSLMAANAELSGIARQLEQLDPVHNRKVGARITPLLASMVGDLQRPLFVLLGAVGLVLLIACANVASLTLGRVAARDGELAVRTALGAARSRIVRQILTESLLLALIGGALGVALAFAGIKALFAIAPNDIPRLETIALDARVLGVTFIVTLITGALFGVVPALHGSSVNLHSRLRSAGRNVFGGSNTRSRKLLVVVEMALAVVLLAGAGLLLRSFAMLRAVDPGFQPDHVATFSVAMPEGKYGTPSQQNEFVSALLVGIAHTPGVESVAAAVALPLSGESFGFTFVIRGQPPTPDNEPRAQTRVVTDRYFATLDIPVLRGRTFNATDNENGRPVLVISNEVARLHFPNDNPIGKYLETGWTQNGRRFGGEVVGVVGDVRQYALDRNPTAHLYMSFSQMPLSDPDIVIRANVPSASVFNAARAVLKNLDNQIPLSGARMFSDIVHQSLGQRRFYLTLLGAFASVAMTLALVGLYGVIAYGAQQRRREIGIRLALGASQNGIVTMVLLDGLRLVAGGVALGIGGAFALSHLLESLLFRIGARDPLAFVIAPALLTVAAVLACLVPARTAARANPLDAIRAE